MVVDLDESKDIQKMQSIILKHVRSASAEALNFMKTFMTYEYIWLEDKQLYLQRFLNECKQKCLEDSDDFPEDKVEDPNARIDLFQAQVFMYIIYTYTYTCQLHWDMPHTTLALRVKRLCVCV